MQKSALCIDRASLLCGRQPRLEDWLSDKARFAEVIWTSDSRPSCPTYCQLMLSLDWHVDCCGSASDFQRSNG